MNEKALIIGVLVVLGILGLMWMGSRNQVEVTSSDDQLIKSFLTAKEVLYDFGTISMKNGNVSHLFRVTNSTDNDITIKTVTTSCMCTKAFIVGANGEKGPFGMPGMGFVPPANEILKAGGSFDVKAVYDPNAHGPAGVGPIDRFIFLKESSGETLELEIKAVVVP
ncbi:MAG: hypothetical protein A3G04_02680 [Candidatus Taylorbacteria bacterium RIFCSPLOWO2_12_FULL_44_9]|nr:MAG: hypothetical protein A3G04_02680 [Candidatus Taylorbacteria bacterium RIFCSPLOWO2_12_FULL_44_9]